MNNVSVNNLIMEVTRKCNMSCDHCLRGDAQSCDMSIEVIEKTLSQFSNIGSILFTGGEPLMAFDRISHIIDYIIEHEITLGGFYLVTNGTICNNEIIGKLIDLYCYVDQTDEGCCSICVSQDMFHDDVNKANLKKFKTLNFYSSGKDYSKVEQRKYEKGLIAEGRAAEYGLGTAKRMSEELYIEDYGDGEYRVDELYINAKGNIIPDCDYSYESQEDFEIGNVLEEDLYTIIRRAAGEEEKEDCAEAA